MWHQINLAASRIVSMGMVEKVDPIKDTDLLDLLGKKQILDEKYESMKEYESQQDIYRKQIHELQDKLDLAHASQMMRGTGMSNAYHTKVVDELVSQVAEYMDVRYMRDDPVYSKYFTMLEKGKTLEEVVQICKADKVDDQVIRGCPIQLTIKPNLLSRQATVASAGTAVPEEDPNDPRKNPEYERWFKMVKVGIPKAAVQAKMQAEGVDPSILDYASNTSAGASQSTDQEDEWKPRQKADKSKEEEKKEKKEPEYNPPKAKRNPDAKLKNIYWDPVVGEPLRGSMWETLQDDKVQIDFVALCNAFQAKESTFLTASTVSADPCMKKPDEMVKLVTDDKRLRNVGMAIARLKMSYESLREDILRVNDAVLTNDILRMLAENAPTAEEISLVKDYDGKIELLGDVDRFFKVLSSIPNLQLRIKNLQMRVTLEADMKEFQEDFEAFSMGMSKLCKSQKLVQLLESILAIGNYMNGMFYWNGLMMMMMIMIIIVNGNGNG